MIEYLIPVLLLFLLIFSFILKKTRRKYKPRRSRIAAPAKNQKGSFRRQFSVKLVLLGLILLDSWAFFWAAIYEYAFWHHVKSFLDCFVSSLWAWMLLVITLPLTVYFWLLNSQLKSEA